jgi:protocatechuate 3,4-dioxygenase beta subunit
VDITGDAACPVNLGDSVTLVLGETLECTITNDDNPASISGIKFHDLNANSIQDGIESGLAGWTIELRDDNGVLLDTNVTDIDGNYSFPSLASGDYRVQEVEQPGWKKTEPGGLYHPVSLALGESAIRDFGNYQLGSIHGTKYDDIDGDGQLDGFDVPLEGWTINLDGPGGPYTTQTDADGNYWFMDLELGSYNVSEEQQTGWIQTSATPTSILIEAGTVSEDNDFFNFKLAEIHGYKYHDLNNDGNKDAGEPGLPGWIINLGGAGNASTTTDGNGAYWFMDLGPGIYHLTEDNQPGWMQTEPGGGLVQYSPGSGAVRENLNFGNLQYATIIVEKQTLPDGETQNFDFSGDASGTIQDDGQIIVSGLLPGQYSSTETVPAGWDLTDITCDDNDSSGDINTAIATFELQAGEIVTCVFTNSKKPTLTVIKQVTNDDGGTATTSDFILYIDGNPVSSGVSTEVSIGAHIVSEDSLPGYTGTISGDCDANGNVEVDPNEDKTCIITNEDEGNAIHGQKFEDLNGNGVKDAGEPGLAGWRIRLRDMDLAQQHANTLTDANGNYWFMDLPPGNYRVTERQQTGWQITTPVSPARYDLQLDLGEVHEDLDFGNFKLGEIHGMKFNDLNNDGIKDAGEPGLENWTINITGPNGFATSTITDIDGNFWFMNLGLGDYEVSEVMQVGWLQSMPADNGNYEISIESSGQVFEDQDFGNFMPNAINGIKFEDVDGDGIYSSSTDVLLADWEIVLLDSDNNELASTTTDINGTFSFIDIEAGDYKVKEIQQTGWQASTAEEYELTFTTNNASTTDLFFGNYRPAEIHGVKFLDRNSDGAYQPLDEEGVSDWIIILELDGQEVATTTTDVEGEYWFMDLAPGTYDVTEEERDGWTQTFPGAPDYAHEVTVQSSEVVEDINFGNIVPASINGVKFEDLNGNGFRDENEPGLAGWRIRLRNLTTNVVIATTTDELGRYKFINIDPDDYRVSERQKDGWVQTAPQDPNTYTVTVNPGDIWVGADFGNFRLASVTGIKYEDINGNATRDEGEPALPGWTIELRDFEGTFIASTTTNALGQYTFNELGPETFLLNEVAQPDWFQSEPIAALGGVHTLGVNESGKTYERNFGNYRHGSIRGRKFQDDNFNGVRDSGEDWLAGWTIELTSLQTGATFQKVTNANGRYRFNNLAPGSYLVKEILQPGWLFTTPIVRHVKVLSNQNVSGIHFGNNEISEFLANGLSLPSPGGGPVQLSENSNDFEIQENPGEIDLPEINIELPEFIRNRSRSGLGSFGNRGR